MKKRITLIPLMISLYAYSQTGQVGINTMNPQAIFHVDGARDNPKTGVPSSTQQLNDFVVSSSGNVGIGDNFPNSPLAFANVFGRKISVFSAAANNHQYNGFGVESNAFINQVNATNSNFLWRSGNGVAASNNLMALTGTGRLGLGTITPANMLTVNGGKFQYLDGTQANTLVLTSDSNGVASWKAPKPVAITQVTVLGSGVNLTPTSFMVPTGTSITLPPGKWKVSVQMLLSKGGSATANNESWWIRSSFSDNSAGGSLSGDLVGSTYASGCLPPFSRKAMLSGSLVLNNTTSGNKTYYYVALGSDSIFTSGNIVGFAANSEPMNMISIEPIN